jgi:SAM-dependent methyltransferase
MSSPLAKKHKGIFDKILIAIHKRSSHSKRVEILSSLFVEAIRSINPDNKTMRLLDVGCGDMSVAKSMASKYKLEYICIDIYPNIEGWENYLEFDGIKMPFGNKEFDVLLFSDVLHHDTENMKSLLFEAKRVTDKIIIKDHFEFGIWSRRVLQLADFVGNYGYGVSIPKHYLSKQSFSSLLLECGLKEIKQLYPINLYDRSPLINLFLRNKYQFISIIQ